MDTLFEHLYSLVFIERDLFGEVLMTMGTLKNHVPVCVFWHEDFFDIFSSSHEHETKYNHSFWSLYLFQYIVILKFG
jgi:hypothetical protein